MYYEEITLEHLDELARLYVETFNSEPWNDEWTICTAAKRLHQMINTEDSYGLCAYRDGDMCGVILGCMEQFYNGIGTQMFSEFERRLKERQVNESILFTSKGDFTEHFYHK